MGTIRAKLQRIMSKFVYEENPQVTFLKEKCEKLEEENKKLKELCEWLREKSAEDFRRKKEARRFYEERIEEFNRFPWWKKMFYRFYV